MLQSLGPDLLLKIVMAGCALACAFFGLHLKIAMQDRKLAQEQDKNVLLSALGNVKAEIIKSQNDMKAELVNSDSQTRGELNVHVAQDTILFGGIDEKFDEVDKKFDRVDQRLGVMDGNLTGLRSTVDALVQRKTA